MMIYPIFIKEGDLIGVTAPSDGVVLEEKVRRLEFAKENLEKRGYKTSETFDVRTSIRGKSAPSEVQAQELLSLYKDDDVAMIWCSGGGDFLLEMLSFVNFQVIKKYPKWLQGYSDPTGLLFVITTNLDIATIYGDNFCTLGMEVWHESLVNNLEILEGKRLVQTSFEKYESGYTEYIKGNESYKLDSDVKWECVGREKNLSFTGRIIGGCIDVLAEICGTRFDKTKEFIWKYKSEGIIWYFDNCEKSCEDIRRILWKFREAGWFDWTTGIIFGRWPKVESYYDFTIEETLKEALGNLDVHIVFNADIGHVAPRMTIINGAIATVKLLENKGTISFQLK